MMLAIWTPADAGEDGEHNGVDSVGISGIYSTQNNFHF